VPDTVVESKFGVFDAFSRGAMMERLLDGLGSYWEMLRICVKCYAAHLRRQDDCKDVTALFAPIKGSTVIGIDSQTRSALAPGRLRAGAV
jgi:hypothetical protein